MREDTQIDLLDGDAWGREKKEEGESPRPLVLG